MQNVPLSPILQSYIKNNKLRALNPNTNAKDALLPSKEETKPPLSDFEIAKKQKKKKIAKIALFAASAITVLFSVGAACRNKKGIVDATKMIKDKGTEFANEAVGAIEDIGEKVNEKGLSNTTNIKDACTREVLEHVPFYKKFDNFVTNIYKKAVSGTMSRSITKARQNVIKADNAVLDAMKNSKLEKNEASRLQELISKREKNILDYAKGSNVNSRFQTLDFATQGINKDAINVLKEAKSKGIMSEFKRMLKESVTEKKLENVRNIQKETLRGYKNLGLSNDEMTELEGLVKKLGDNGVLGKFKNSFKFFDKVYAKESVDLFNKVRDINFGSAPTDIEGILTTLLSVAGYTAMADSKEERVQVGLTTGIPLLASGVTTLFATCKMVSGVRALGLGLATGLVARSIGKFANKKYLEKRNLEAPEKTIVSFDDFFENIEKLPKSF